MARFVRMGVTEVRLRDEELRERIRVFGMDDAHDAWSDLPPEIRGDSFRYRREGLEFARHNAFSLPDAIRPATWRKWVQRARALGFTFERWEPEGEPIQAVPYTGSRWI